MKDELKKEMLRKIIHVSGLAYIPAVILLGSEIVASAVIVITFIAILFEFQRKRRRTSVDFLLRDYERKRIPGYIYTGMAFSIITPFFSTEACIVSAVAAFAGDGVAGIVKRIKPELSLLSFIMPSLILTVLLPVNQIYALASILIASLFDGRRWEDNFTVPLSSAFSYWILEIFFG